jgi:hypothetical protein
MYEGSTQLSSVKERAEVVTTEAIRCAQSELDEVFFLFTVHNNQTGYNVARFKSTNAVAPPR